MSHNVTVKVEMRNREAIAAAIKVMGGTVMGIARHNLFESSVDGLGFRLPGWQYPLVLKEDGELVYDDYKGVWGNVKDLETLKEWYALTAVQLECKSLGWYCEFDPVQKNVKVFHPDGGTIEVSKEGVVDATGFTGPSCELATQPLEAALGKRLSQTLKPEHSYTEIRQKEQA
jgi:hypothetical protein